MHAMNLKHLFCVPGLLMCACNLLGQHMNVKNGPCQGIDPAARETQCFITESQSADKELNSALGKIRKVLNADDQHRLQLAQSLWIQYRQVNCEAERGLYDGGSAASMVYYACLAADTRHRISELNMMYGWIVEKSTSQCVTSPRLLR
jgi:uncharacterized protein YecT (DUF1311 family)